ncbi:hypothetical protein EVAR_27521_1 [Eumeta japonica]|uniref:Uncharacterized protein n=1 Tax=Eumeta variegata TaxID=151549 RepID=A0A4C1W6M4_EUMVA|nr:hypothetical protein EVAR_27521_1 [Eumeta japonica]
MRAECVSVGQLPTISLDNPGKGLLPAKDRKDAPWMVRSNWRRNKEGPNVKHPKPMNGHEMIDGLTRYRRSACPAVRGRARRAKINVPQINGQVKLDLFVASFIFTSFGAAVCAGAPSNYWQRVIRIREASVCVCVFLIAALRPGRRYAGSGEGKFSAGSFLELLQFQASAFIVWAAVIGQSEHIRAEKQTRKIRRY